MSLFDKLAAGARRLLPLEQEYMSGEYLRAMGLWSLRERIDVGNFDFLREGVIRFTQFQAKHTPGGMQAVIKERLNA